MKVSAYTMISALSSPRNWILVMLRTVTKSYAVHKMYSGTFMRYTLYMNVHR